MAGQTARPGDHERYPYTAFVEPALAAAQWRVVGARMANLAAVVAALLRDGVELPDIPLIGGPYSLLDASGDHSFVWDPFYVSTVQGSWDSTGPLPELPGSINLNQKNQSLVMIVLSALGRAWMIWIRNLSGYHYQ